MIVPQLETTIFGAIEDMLCEAGESNIVIATNTNTMQIPSVNKSKYKLQIQRSTETEKLINQRRPSDARLLQERTQLLWSRPV